VTTPRIEKASSLAWRDADYLIGDDTGNGMTREKNGAKRYPIDVDADEARCCHFRLGVHFRLLCIYLFMHSSYENNTVLFVRGFDFFSQFFFTLSNFRSATWKI